MKEKYGRVQTVGDIIDYIGDSDVVAFDYECSANERHRTESKAALDAAKANLTGCSFSVMPGTGIYAPLAHINGRNLDSTVFRSFMAEFLNDKTKVKVAHNMVYESAMSYKNGIVIQAPVYDTMCAAQMVLKNDYDFRNLTDSGLKTLAKTVLNEPIPTFEAVTGGRHFDELDPDDYETIRYAAADADYALRLYYLFNDWFGKYLPAHRTIVEEIESPAAVYIGLMKYNGLPIDQSLMQSKKAEVDHQLCRIREDIELIIGDVDIGTNCSTKAFKDYLFKDLRLPIMKTTATNREAVDDTSMTLLSDWCRQNRPELIELFQLVQQFRRLQKIKSTYIDGYSKFINSVTGNIHPDIFSLSTETGRMSCQHPNAQNMPRKSNDPVGIRSFIKAPEGHSIVSCDFSQIELRVGAFYCRDLKMMETYRTGGDIHAATTSVIYGISPEQAADKNAPDYKERRTIAKNVNFGTFYGLYPKGLQQTLQIKAGIVKSYDECQDIIESIKKGYRMLTIWQKETIADARRKGYTETWLGRRRYLPDIRSEDWGRKSFAERCALNTPIQGTAADILKLAAGRILTGLPSRPWLRPILQIHDELVFIVPDDRVTEAVCFIKQCMEQQPFREFDIPLIAEAAVGPDFGHLKDINN